MMVLEYATSGSLRNYLDENYKNLSWQNKILNLLDIATGLKIIHKNGLIHRDLHIGNILKFDIRTSITDMGLCKPVDSETSKPNIYGVLSYIAPEILRGQKYTEAADIYSFGIIMYEVISGLPPYYDVNHNKNLAIEICRGLRPKFKIKVPQLILHLIKRCLDTNPSNRPTAEEIGKVLFKWHSNLTFNKNSSKIEFVKQIKETDEINSGNLSTHPNELVLSYKTHYGAIYTSKLLDFENLPEPKNSDDYYEKYDNITSMEYSGNNKLLIY